MLNCSRRRNPWLNKILIYFPFSHTQFFIIRPSYMKKYTSWQSQCVRTSMFVPFNFASVEHFGKNIGKFWCSPSKQTIIRQQCSILVFSSWTNFYGSGGKGGGIIEFRFGNWPLKASNLPLGISHCFGDGRFPHCYPLNLTMSVKCQKITKNSCILKWPHIGNYPSPSFLFPKEISSLLELKENDSRLGITCYDVCVLQN